MREKYINYTVYIIYTIYYIILIILGIDATESYTKNIMINYTKLYVVKHYGMINIDSFNQFSYIIR